MTPERPGQKAEGHRVTATAAEFLRDRQPQIPLVGERANQLGWGALDSVPVIGEGRDVLFSEGLEFGLSSQIFGCKLHENPPYPSLKRTCGAGKGSNPAPHASKPRPCRVSPSSCQGAPRHESRALGNRPD